MNFSDIVDERSHELIDEFQTHFGELVRENPKFEKREAFEGWALQKIASLQLAVEILAAKNNKKK